MKGEENEVHSRYKCGEACALGRGRLKKGARLTSAQEQLRDSAKARRASRYERVQRK